MSKQISEQLLRDFEPKESWLAHDSHLHGVGHMTRVFVLQELICDELEGQQAQSPGDQSVMITAFTVASMLLIAVIVDAYLNRQSFPLIRA